MLESSSGLVFINPSQDEVIKRSNGSLSPNGAHHFDETDLAPSRQPPTKFLLTEPQRVSLNPSQVEITKHRKGTISLTPDGSHYSDETDLAPSRQPPTKNHQTEPQRVHFIWDLFAVASILTFLFDVSSDIAVSVLYYIDGSYLWFSLTIGFVILSSIVMQVFSAKWFYEDDEEQTWGTYLLHFFQLGPLMRFWRVIKAGQRTRQENSTDGDYEVYLAEWRDISMLRLFECFLESAPQLVLQLYIMAYNRRFEIESDLFTALAAGSSLVSLGWAIVAYTKALRDFLGTGNGMSWIGFLLQIVWRMSMIASRVVALVLFASYYTTWLFVAMAAHWFIMTSWLVCQKTSFCVDDYGRNHFCREYLFDSVIGFVYIFCFFNIKEGMTRIRVIPYYVIMLGENTLFIVMWYPYRTLYGEIETASLSVVWGGFALGVICMVSYYRFYHPSLPVKGICVRKTQLEMESNKPATIYWCCCCEIQTKYAGGDENENKSSFALRERPYYDPRRNTPAYAQAQGRLPMDVDILPRMKSRESASTSPRNTTYRPASSNGIVHGIRSMYKRSEWL